MSIRRYLSNIDNQQTLKRQKTKHKQLEITVAPSSSIDHFTVMDGNEAGVDLVLI